MIILKAILFSLMAIGILFIAALGIIYYYKESKKRNMLVEIGYIALVLGLVVGLFLIIFIVFK